MCKKEINPEFEAKLDMMFLTVTATGAHDWAPSSVVLPPDSGEAFNVEVSLDSDDDLDCFIETIASSLGKRKRTPTKQGDAGVGKNNKGIGKGKVGGIAKLSQQIDQMVESIQNRSTVTLVMNRGISRTSITEVMKSVSFLPGYTQVIACGFLILNCFLIKRRERCLSL